MENRTLFNTEINKLFAVFMGSEYRNDPYDDKDEKGNKIKKDYWHWSKPDTGYPYDMCMLPPIEMSCAFAMGNWFYHTSWDWLMTVITKIESLGYEVLISRVACQINPILERENPIASMVCGDITKKREIVFETCKQFIEWYNEKQSKIN